MRTVDSVFLDFVRIVVDGDVDEVTRRLDANPALATASSSVGATRHGASTFFFTEIAHYLYSNHWARRQRFSARTPATDRYRKATAETRRHGDRPGRER